MSTILVWVEQHDGSVGSSALGVVCKAVEVARDAGGEVAALVCGPGADAAAGSLGAFGVSKVLIASGDALAAPVAEPYVDALGAAVAATNAGIVFASASVLAAEVAGGFAARSGTGINTDCVGVRVDGDAYVVQRPALDDSVYVDCGWVGDGGCAGVVLFRAGAFVPQPANGSTASVETLDVASSARPASLHLGHEHAETGGVDITQAEVLVGAGRGLGGPENFGLVESLANAIGGEVATTRAVVDAGWYDYATQVGQTGKTVTPKLYVAVGISGAIQHKVGMQNSGTVIAINKDPNAPIFEYADLGVVGDLFEIVPKLEAAIRGEARVMTAIPSEYPPPVKTHEFIAEPQAGEEDRLDVGILIVGGGPAGLACAIRAGQLLADRPALMERLGDVPIAVVDKARTPGAHQLSGAVVRPQSLRELLPDMTMEQLSSYGEVPGEAVYALTRKRAFRITPMPPPFKNHGNHIFSLAKLTRVLSEQAEACGAMILPETDAHKLLVDDGDVRGVLTGDKGRGREGEELGAFEPGAELHAQATVLAEGTQGHLTTAAIEQFSLAPGSAPVWELGVKEVWKVTKPLGKVIHTMGWPFKLGAKWREFGGSFLYPMGDDHLCIGLVVGLDYRDSSLSVHDLLQELKTHPMIAQLLEGGERVAWGAKTIPSGGLHSMPAALSVPGAVLCGDGAGMVNVPRLKGVNYAIRSGMLAAEAIIAQLEVRAAGDTAALDLSAYDTSIRASEIYRDLHEVRNMRQVFHKGFFLGGALSSLMVLTKGRFPGRTRYNIPDAENPMSSSGRRYSTPDGKLTFDKLSSVFLSGNKTRDDQPNHIRIDTSVPRDVAETWVNMCPAAVYEIDDEAPAVEGMVTVRMAPSNCVHCGAISAKGGRLTPPEGGSGPEYALM